jgi:type II secretory pathway component PulM
MTELDPVTTLTTRFGQAASEARRKTDSLTSTMRELALVTHQLNEHGVEVQVDLGPIGNSAFARFQDLEREREGGTFKLPTTGGER